MTISDTQILGTLLSLTSAQKTVAPRDIALALLTSTDTEKFTDKQKDWRTYLPKIKKICIEAEKNEQIVFWRKGKIVPSNSVRGVYRLAKPEKVM